ncbi:MAG: type IX secretion system sortase PorU [Sphingobacteriales bacterium]|nr:type IX secretion system sortase PorU [Sphingobacteriales bacterium]
MYDKNYTRFLLLLFCYSFLAVSMVQAQYTEQSVLNQGEFYKFRLKETGIYILDKNFLEKLGVDVSKVNVNKIRIYGNSGGMLPERAGAERADDLLENAIEVVDKNNNNVFDNDDAIYFYAESPHQWQYDSTTQKYYHTTHLYSDYNHYFLNFDIGAGKRISEVTPASAAVEYESESGDALIAHETESINLLRSGRRWYGESFTSGYSRTISFSVPHLKNDEAVTAQMALAARDEFVKSQFEIKYNNTLLKQLDYNQVGTSTYGPYAYVAEQSTSFNAVNESINLQITLKSNSSNTKGWLDYMNIQARQYHDFSSFSSLEQGQRLIYDKKSIGKATRYTLTNTPASLRVWDCTQAHEVSAVVLQSIGSNQRTFISDNTDTEHHFIAFEGNIYLVPEAVGKIEKQNLHAPESPDYLIITTPLLSEAATALADFHRTNSGLSVKVVFTDEIYNEFASGNSDITALRDYIRMYYQRGTPLKYVLLFGDASYDYKNIITDADKNTNLVPVYESVDSEHTVGTYCSDDYFVLSEDHEGSNLSNNFTLDAAIGRISVDNAEQALAVVEKIKHYKSEASKGSWLNQLTFVADDGDGNLHLNHAEAHTDFLKKYPQYNIDKIYLDAYQQISTSGNDRYPTVNDAINNKILNGTFLVNYVGHGGEKNLASEAVIDIPMIQGWKNKDKLPLFVTATCTFSRFDDPQITAAGEYVIFNPDGGGIASVTTTRPVTAGNNKIMNLNFLEYLFEPIDGAMPTIGDVMRLAKNASANTGINNRKFTLLGDPALRLNYPSYDIQTTAIEIEEAESDTLKALSRVRLNGKICDDTGTLLPNFNGQVYINVLDKETQYRTLAQDKAVAGDAGSVETDFSMQKNSIFRGSAQVSNGEFELSFVVPKDINYSLGQGKISYYAQAGLADAAGVDTTIIVGGISNNNQTDPIPPVVEVFINDEHFKNGGITNNNPKLFVKLYDDSGFNASGTGIGHDMKGFIDEDTQVILLNDAYEANAGDYRYGTITFQLSNLSAGLHTAKVRVWDSYNNPGEGVVEFVVMDKTELVLENLINFPNPVSTETTFAFDHNYHDTPLEATLRIFNTAGQLVKTINATLNGGNRNQEITWQADSDGGSTLSQGIYIYELTVKEPVHQSTAHLSNRLLLVR